MNLKNSGSFAAALFFVASANCFCADDRIVIKGENMEFRNKGLLTVYRNGVVIKRGKDWLEAAEAVSNEKTDELLIEGNITAYYCSDDGSIVKMTASAARYDKSGKHGILYGNPKVAVENKSDKEKGLKMQAEIIELYEDAGIIEARDNVYLSSSNADLWAEKAVYNQKKKEIVFTGGDPFIVSMEDGVLDYYKSRKITVLTEENIIIFDNQAKSLVWGGSKDAESGESK